MTAPQACPAAPTENAPATGGKPISADHSPALPPGSNAGLTARGEATSDSRRPLVLVVEDHRDMAAYIRRHLESAYRVIEAARGDLGLRLAANELPDLIVSDIMMPGMDGYSLCRAIKADPKLDCIPVILLTARVELEDKLEGFECGADEYLTKPFNSRELMARVRNLLKARDRLDDHVRAEASRMALRPAPLQRLSDDERFLRRVRGVLEMEGCDPTFGVDALAQRLSLSRMHLYRRLHGLTQASPSDLLIGFRLEKAAQMLAQGAGNATQVAFAVGFKDSSHFSKRFRDRYGLSPTAYAASHES